MPKKKHQPACHLTAKGKRLYWLYFAWDETKHEYAVEEFVREVLAQDGVQLRGTCLSCGRDVDALVIGAFCLKCCRATYVRE